MPFDAPRWSEPRKAIATGLNDIQYAIHGGLIAVEVLRALNEPWDVLSKSTLLDFGCGTGRIARVLTKAFARVDGYDPSLQAIAEGVRECPSHGAMTFHNLDLMSVLPPKEWDYAIAVNVFEHIQKGEQLQTWNDLRSRVRKKIVVYAHPYHNAELPFNYTHEGMHLFVL
jgi:2-polyprenyl-3-methyl-5-hydroxy-6-metoxy-1,4-benzoquinol methylase